MKLTISLFSFLLFHLQLSNAILNPYMVAEYYATPPPTYKSSPPPTYKSSPPPPYKSSPPPTYKSSPPTTYKSSPPTTYKPSPPPTYKPSPPPTYKSSPPPSPPPPPAPQGGGNIPFIRESCRNTLYPDVCFNSLVSYAKKIKQDPSRLAIAAIGVSLSKAKRMANYVSNVSRQADYGPEPRIAAALHDCFSVFGDAVDQMKDSLKQMNQLNVSGKSFRFQMSNVQTWMSAAMTNEDTCTDGLSDVPNCPVKNDVISRVDNSMQVTSNALALVNNFVEKVTTP